MNFRINVYNVINNHKDAQNVKLKIVKNQLYYKKINKNVKKQKKNNKIVSLDNKIQIYIHNKTLKTIKKKK